MNRLIHPFGSFALIQLVPLFLWLLAPEDVFNMAMQDYGRPHFGWKSLAVYAGLIASFYAGCRLSSLWQRDDSVSGLDSNDIAFVRKLHFAAIILAAISVLVVVTYCLSSGISIWETVLMAQANRLKAIVYSAGVLPQAFMMARHLVITALISWFVLRRHKAAPGTLLIVLLMGGVLFLFTSSRLTVMAMIVIAMLANLQTLRRADAIRAVLFGVALVLVFGIGVYTRSFETWAAATGSTNPLRIVGMELTAYLISPVNYSVALVEHLQSYHFGSGLATLLSFVVTVLNLDGSIDRSYLADISYYYNPNLNQIGLVGQLFVGFGPLFFIPTILYGLAAGAAFQSLSRGGLAGSLIYPLIYLAIFDSFRGLLLTQNIIMANILFVGLLLILYRYKVRPFNK